MIPASEVSQHGVARAAVRARAIAGTAARGGYWLHLDVDVLDPAVMPAVDSPDPGGLDAGQLTGLLAELAPAAIGAQVTVYDPDLDPDGGYASLISGILVSGLAGLGTGLSGPAHRATKASACC